MLFAHSILNYENSPPKLKEIIKLPDNNTNYTEIDQYNFSQGAKAKKIIPLTKYEHPTFRFFPRDWFQNIVDLTMKSQAFKVQVNIVSKKFQKKTIQYFPRFDIAYVMRCGRRVERGSSR